MIDVVFKDSCYPVICFRFLDSCTLGGVVYRVFVAQRKMTIDRRVIASVAAHTYVLLPAAALGGGERMQRDAREKITPTANTGRVTCMFIYAGQ